MPALRAALLRRRRHRVPLRRHSLRAESAPALRSGSGLTLLAEEPLPALGRPALEALRKLRPPLLAKLSETIWRAGRRSLQSTSGLALGWRGRGLAGLALRRRSLGTPAALTSLTSRAAGARTFGRTLRAARGHGRTKFLLLEFTVVVLVEGQQRLRGIRDLVLIELAVLIDIQRRDDGRNHGAELSAPAAGLTGLARLTGSAGLRRHGLGRRRGWLRGCGGCRRNRILCEQSAGGSQRGEQ